MMLAIEEQKQDPATKKSSIFWAGRKSSRFKAAGLQPVRGFHLVAAALQRLRKTTIFVLIGHR